MTTFNGRSGAVVPAEGDYTAKMVGAVAEPDGGKAGQVLTKTEDGTEWGDAPNAENAVTVPGGGTMQMGESLGDGPYTIEVTEDGEGGGISAEQVGYSNTGSGLEATNVQDAIDELAGKGGGEYLPLTGGTMTGPLTLSGLPTSENHAANKQYVDEQVGSSRVVMGTYIGDGAPSQTIQLGFTPKAVLVCQNGILSRGYQNHYAEGLALDGYPAAEGNSNVVSVVEGGFQVFDGTSANYNGRTNVASQKYYYLTWK